MCLQISFPIGTVAFIVRTGNYFRRDNDNDMNVLLLMSDIVRTTIKELQESIQTSILAVCLFLTKEPVKRWLGLTKVNRSFSSAKTTR